MNALEEIVGERVDRFGPVPFDQVMELALYHPDHGFYATGGQAGRRGDFLTSPEVGPLFGAVVARALDGWWQEMGRPDPFVVVEAGAGVGTLARTVLAAGPDCAGALRYVLVERSARLRSEHGRYLDLTSPTFGLGPFTEDADGVEQAAQPGAGPMVVSLGELPSVELPVVVIANELLDNLPFRLLARTEPGWAEVRVGLTADRSGLAEVLVAADDEQVRTVEALADAVPVGGRVPLQEEAGRWLRRALHLAAPGGRVVVLDYAATTHQLGQRRPTGWLRTYRGQDRGSGVLDSIGIQDITGDVCVDQLARIRRPAAQHAQAEWLRSHGIDVLVEEGKRVWTERAHLGDLEAVRARSRVTESEALCDPSGLGAFAVIEWTA